MRMTLRHARAHAHPNPLKHIRQYNTTLWRSKIRFLLIIDESYELYNRNVD